MEQQYIYVVFSSTPYKMGKLIRKVTRENFNHVSISLDAELTQMYSFARRHYRLPLYGGFVRESRSRYHVNGIAADICLCAVPVSARQHLTLRSMLQDMHRKNRFYIYNHLSALGAVFHRPIHARDAYTCAEFCMKILKELDIPVQPDKYYSIGDIRNLLDPFVIYSGTMPAPEIFDEAYYAKKPVRHPIYTTLRDMIRLLHRVQIR